MVLNNSKLWAKFSKSGE